MKELIENVIDWAHERGIFDPEDGSSALIQTSKLIEEVVELRDEIQYKELTCDGYVRLELGDCLVVLTLIAEFEGTSLEECLQLAYTKIKDRKGRMVGGKFVKEA
jgi:NTP pyrophosphatase (non-canonical NTP hydrolase)